MSLFFTHENLLDQSFVIYILPIISMVVTLVFIRNNVPFDSVPGFYRISGLMTLIAATFIIILAIHKTRLWVVFHGSIFMLAGFALVLFAILNVGGYLLFRGPSKAEDDLHLRE